MSNKKHISSHTSLCRVHDICSLYHFWVNLEVSMVRVVNIGLNHEIAPTGYKVSWSTNSLFGMSQLVFDYFCERTPRSYVESRETSLVWNYKYAGKDLAQLLLGCKKNLQEEGQVSVNWESESQNQQPLPLSHNLQFLSWTALAMYILVKLHLVRSDGFLMLVTN